MSTGIETEYRYQEGLRHLILRQVERVTQWGDHRGAVRRRLEVQNGGNGQTVDLTVHTSLTGALAEWERAQDPRAGEAS